MTLSLRQQAADAEILSAEVQQQISYSLSTANHAPARWASRPGKLLKQSAALSASGSFLMWSMHARSDQVCSTSADISSPKRAGHVLFALVSPAAQQKSKQDQRVRTRVQPRPVRGGGCQ